MDYRDKSGWEAIEVRRKNRRTEYYSKLCCTRYFEGSEETRLQEPVELMLINISFGGLGIISPRFFETDTVLVLDMTLEEEHYEKISARVMWSVKKGDMYRLGLSISNPSGKLFRQISKLDNSIVEEV